MCSGAHRGLPLCPTPTHHLLFKAKAKAGQRFVLRAHTAEPAWLVCSGRELRSLGSRRLRPGKGWSFSVSDF